MELVDWLGKDNKIGIDIFTKKYAADKETFDQSLDRISGKNKEIRRLIEERKFLPGGRIMANRGLEYKGRKVTLSNCYVVSPPEDNIESIFDCAGKLARTYSYGGGCGVDISGLSPKGARINNAAKETSGAISFMDLYSLVTQLIGQNGRRGALMISMDCSHPDIEDFIKIKTDLNRVTKANISIRFSDEFMNAVIEDKPFTLHYTREATGQQIEKIVKARELFRLMAETNWDFAEPGALFWDHISSWNLLSNTKEFSYAGTNPCGEEPLPAGGSCLLGSMNLSEYVIDPFTKKASFDFDRFTEDVAVCVTGLNDILEEGLPMHPLEEQRNSVRDWRQIGLGIMGLADMMIKMGIVYGSKKSVDLCDKIGFAMADSAIARSALLAKERGAFPKCDIKAITTTPYFMANTTKETKALVAQYGLRNSQLLTIAPTGTISTMLGISGGIEPIFANFFTRKTESLNGKDVYYKVYTSIVKKYMDDNDITDDDALPEYFITSMDINYKARINVQAAWQKHIDASISSTVNVSNAFTVDDVVSLYIYAYQNGLKGVTLFRDGCRRSAVLTVGKEKENNDTRAGEGLARGQIVHVTDDVIGKKRKLVTGCGTLHCIAMFDPKNGALLEAYLSKGSTGGCNQFMVGLSRMISMSARAGISIYTIIDQLNSSGSCPSYAIRSATKHDTSPGACCPMAVGNALLDMYKEMKRDLEEGRVPERDGNDEAEEDENVKEKVICPECGQPLSHEGGCVVCKNCGWSKCF